MIFLGIDGGQTSTKVCLYNAETEQSYMEKGPPIDHLVNLVGLEKARKGIQDSLKAILLKVDGTVKVKAAMVSISGLLKEHEQLVQEWINIYCPVEEFLVEGDAIANLAGASAGKNDGVLIIAGGGSLGYYLNEDGNEFVSGGWGYILGDEGSAYWIGLNALKQAILDADGRGEPTVLNRLLLEHFQVNSYWDIKKKLHSEALSRKEIADLSVIVNAAAENGDALSRILLRNAGRSLGELAISVLEKVEKQGKHTPDKIYPTGGVFLSNHWVKPAFAETLIQAYPHLQIVEPLFPPVIGAVILAAQKVNVKLNIEKLIRE